jgi:hypothetical protein
MKTNLDNQMKDEVSKLVEEYIKSMNQKDYLAYTIAKEHLGTSFTVEKSVGYFRWLASIGK